jgi:SNF2 family DNA or RNA helicase
MGTGKSPMSIAVAEEMLGSGEVSLCVIVCPASLKYQWAQSLAKFTDLPTHQVKLKKQLITIPVSPDCVLLDGKAFQRDGVSYSAVDDRARQWSQVGPDTEYIILSYETVLSDYRKLRRLNPGLVIADEITAIKSFKALRSKRLKKYLDSPYRIGLTGTPVENGKPEELFSQMQWIDEAVLGRWDLFDATFIERDDDGLVEGYKNLDLLNEKMAPVMSRLTRGQEGVREHMPESEQDSWDIRMPATGAWRDAYMSMGRDLYWQLKQSPRIAGAFSVADYYAGKHDESSAVGKVMAVHAAMEMLLCHPDLVIMSGMDYEETRKLPPERRKGSKYCYKVWQSGILDDVTQSLKLPYLQRRMTELIDAGGKILIYNKFRGMLDILAEDLNVPAVQFHGGMNPGQKAAAVAEFSASDGPPVFLSSHAGAFGVDLPMADHLVNYSPAWSSGKADQINARHVRASSEFKKVYVHDMLVSESVEIRMMAMQDYKREVASGVLGDSGAREVASSVQSLTSFLEDTIDGLDL